MNQRRLPLLSENENILHTQIKTLLELPITINHIKVDKYLDFILEKLPHENFLQFKIYSRIQNKEVNVVKIHKITNDHYLELTLVNSHNNGYTLHSKIHTSIISLPYHLWFSNLNDMFNYFNTASITLLNIKQKNNEGYYFQSLEY